MAPDGSGQVLEPLGPAVVLVKTVGELGREAVEHGELCLEALHACRFVSVALAARFGWEDADMVGAGKTEASGLQNSASARQ